MSDFGNVLVTFAPIEYSSNMLDMDIWLFKCGYLLRSYGTKLTVEDFTRNWKVEHLHWEQYVARWYI